MSKIEEKQWFVIRVPYGRECRLKQYLDTVDVKSFVPMQYKVVESKGATKKILDSVIKNLIFIFDTRNAIQGLKSQCENRIPFRYIMDRSTEMPMIVQRREMEFFIAIAGTYDEQLIYITQMKPSFLQGDRVRVIGGDLQGIEGRVVRIKKDRRVMVNLSCGIGIATGFIQPNLLSKIE